MARKNGIAAQELLVPGSKITWWDNSSALLLMLLYASFKEHLSRSKRFCVCIAGEGNAMALEQHHVLFLSHLLGHT